MARKQSSGKRKRLTLGKSDPKTVQLGEIKRKQPSVGENQADTAKSRWKMARKQSSGKRKRLTLGKSDPKAVQLGKIKRMQPSVGEN